MKYLLPIAFIFIIACQGKLSDEQKKEMREGMKAGEIKKISEAEILDAAFNYGRTIADKIKTQNIDPKDEKSVSDLQEEYQVEIFRLQSGDSLLMEMEQQLIEAYTSASGVQLTDNVQKIGTDSLLYTLPVMEQQPDGSEMFKYALGIRMPKKSVVLSIKD
jgi:hypothetical protein